MRELLRCSRTLWLTVTAVMVLSLLSGTVSATTRTKTVVATIAQIGQPLSEIVDGRIRVATLMGEGVDPHLYRLTRSDVKQLADADLILYNGLDLEVQLLEMMTRFARHKPVVAVAEVVHGRHMADDRGNRDPHIWMDPALWAVALDCAVRAVEDLDRENAAFYRENASAYFRRMLEADTRARKAISSIPPSQRILVTAHDAFGYFGRAYGFDVLAIQGLSTESEAGIRRIETLVEVLNTRRLSAVFVETSVSERNVRALIEGAAARGHPVRIGGRLYSDALGPRGSRTGTWLGMFEHNVKTIVQALTTPVDRTHPSIGPIARSGRSW